MNALTPIIVGGLVLIKGRSNGLYRTYILACLGVFVWSTCYLFWQLTDSPAGAMFYCRWLMVGAVAIMVFYTHHILLLLDRKETLLLTFTYITGGAFVLASLFTNQVVADVRPQLVFSFWPVAGSLYLPFLLAFSGIITYKLVLVYTTMRKSHGTRKSQLEYVFWGTVIAYVGGATNYPLWFDIPFPPYGNPGTSIYLAITSYAILKHRLMDITVIVRKTLVYSVVTGALTCVYLGTITLFAHIFEGLAQYQTGVSSAIAAGLITICFQPIRKRVQSFVDRKFFRQYVDREEKLYELSREVITHTTPEMMAESLIRVLSDTLHPKSAALYLRGRDGVGFMLVSEKDFESLPHQMSENNPLANYFSDHPQPFVQQDLPKDGGEPLDTRRPNRREDAA